MVERPTKSLRRNGGREGGREGGRGQGKDGRTTRLKTFR